jgi:drug/metabolite transporter (DMT)-like permease
MMTPLVMALWIGNVVLDSGGQLAFKAAAIEPPCGAGHWWFMARRPWIWLGIGCYVAEFMAWLAFLSLVPLSDGVMLGSINIVAIMLAGRWLFAERLDRLRVAGMLLVCIGVGVVGAGG